jgi:hypothetical protein
VNGRKARERRKAEGPREQTVPVYRTRPLLDEDRRLIGHATSTPDGPLFFTASGGQSLPRRVLEDGVTVKPSKSHKARVAAAQRGGLVDRVKDLIKGGRP